MFFIFLASKSLYWTLSCRPLSFFAISGMDVEHVDTYTPSTVVNFKRSEGTVVLAKILGPSERGIEYRSITYARSASMVTHDYAPMARMSLPSTFGMHGNLFPRRTSRQPLWLPISPTAGYLPSCWTQNFAPKAAKPRPKRSAAKPAAKPAAKVAAKPAAGEPLPVAPVDHVQLFKVKYSHQRKQYTQPVPE